MPKFQISGDSLYCLPLAAAVLMAGYAYWLLSLSIFLIGLSSRAVRFQTAVQTFASGSPDSPQTVFAA